MKRAALAVLLAVAPVLFAQTPYIVKELHPGFNTAIQSPAFIAVAENLLYFTVGTGTTLALWVTDGTAQGTIELGPLREFPLVAHTAGRSVYFTIGDEIWTSDGTPQGTGPATELIARFPQRPWLAQIVGNTILASVADVLYATKVAPGSPVVRIGAPYGATAVELAGRIFLFSGTRMWETDGTEAGTRLVTAALPHPTFGPAAVLRGEIYFGNTELWKTDGTIDGTVLVATLSGGATSFRTIGNRMFFVVRERELWVTDGTEGGTRALPATVADVGMAAAGDRLIFGGVDGLAIEPWVSDGTAEGTKPLADLVPGNAQSWAGGFVSTGNTVYFSGSDPAHGRELWVTDGTPESTRLVIDMYPGPLDGLPFLFGHANERFFFTATAPVTGREVYAIDVPAPPRVHVADVRVAEENTVARFTIRLTKAATQTMTIAYATSDGDAAAGSDYTATTGTITFAPGELAKTIDVPVFADTLFETNERFFFTAGDATAFAMIEDNDSTADLALRLDFTALAGGTVAVYARNDGPATATNVRRFVTQTPVDPNTNSCATCEALQIAPGAEVRVAERDPLGQAWFSMTIRASEQDPQPANNTVAWTQAGTVALDAPWLTVGSEATLYVAPFPAGGPVTVESSNPAVITVPATLTGSGIVRGMSPGRATIRAFANNVPQGTLEIDVVAPGMTPRWPGALDLQTTGTARIDQPFHLDVRALAIAPFTQHTATGAVTITHNDQVVARGTLTAGSPLFGVDLYGTSVGRNDYMVTYEGDAHFLPQTLQFSYPVSIGRASMTASVERDGANATIRVRVTGSPVVPPTGSVRVVQFGVFAPVTVPLVNGEAVLTLTNLPASARTATLSYFGDERYDHLEKQISLLERRRAVRH